MSVIRRTLVLVGHYAGKTVTLKGYRFTNGKLVLEGPQDQVENLSRYMRRCYQAHLQGSDELAAAQALCEPKKEKPDGSSDPDAEAELGDAAEVDGPIRQIGEGPAEVPADERGGAAPLEARDTGTVPPGDGHEDTGVHPEEEGPERTRLREAVESLDPTKDDNWTEDGLPAISAVETVMGSGGVTREAIEAAAPGHVRKVEEATKE